MLKTPPNYMNENIKMHQTSISHEYQNKDQKVHKKAQTRSIRPKSLLSVQKRSLSKGFVKISAN